MNKTRAFALFVVTLLLLTLIGGCGRKTLTETEMRQQMFSEMRQCLDSIPEADRRAKVQTLMDSIEGDLETMKETVAQFVAANKKLNADYDATRHDFNKLQARFNGSRQQLQQQILTAKFQIKELVTADEWAKLASIKNSMMQELSKMN